MIVCWLTDRLWIREKISKVVINDEVLQGLDEHGLGAGALASVPLDFLQLNLFVLHLFETELFGLYQAEVLLESLDRIMQNVSELALVLVLRKSVVLVTVSEATGEGHDEHLEADQGVFQTGNYGVFVKRVSVVVETVEKLLLEDGDHDFLPKRKEKSDLDRQKLEKRRIRSEGFMQGVIEQHKVIERVGSRNTNNPGHK